jgi:hypothetical protein
MAKSSSGVRVQVGVEPGAQLRWLLDFGNLDSTSLSAEQRAAVVQEARAFVILQQLDPVIRERMRSWSRTDAAPDVLRNAEVWSAQRWLKQGLDLLRRSEKWNFKPRVEYQLDAHGDLFWARMTANSRLEQFKALAYDTFRDARFKFRRCPECKRPFVPVRRQAYCSAGCSQAVRTRKWRQAHPEKNREIRRQQYKRSVAVKLRLSRRARIKVAKRGSPR